MGYTKLFSKILASSIWNEDDKTRLVWITLLAMRNERNVVQGSIGGVAHQARVSLEDCKRAIEKLCGPDPDDSSGVAEGRRLEPVTGGWLIINAEAYRRAQTEDERKAYHAAYMRAWRQKQSCVNVTVNECDNGDHKCSHVIDVTQVEKSRVEQNRTEQIKKYPLVPIGTKNKYSRPLNYEEVKAYVCDKLNLPENDACALWEHWRGNGFRNNGSAMEDWRMVASNWERRKIFFPSIKPTNGFNK